MNKEKTEKMKENARRMGYDYTIILIDKIFNAYMIEENEDIKDLLEELLDYIYKY